VLVLTVNSGSTSVKLAAFSSSSARGALEAVRREQYPGRTSDSREVLRAFLRQFDASDVAAVAHRVVHGGTQFSQAVLVDEPVEAALRRLAELAPLHNPLALDWIDAARAMCAPAVRQIAAFDTAFFADLPRVAAEYALPRAQAADLGVRRYGFHGIAHQAMWRRWCELHPQLARGGRIITLQLGGGCSATAIESGRPLDTSMGFSPLEGLMMATRSGDVDPAAVAYLAEKQQVPAGRIVEFLNRECGLLGVSGVGSDMRQLIAGPSEAAGFAVELYCYRVRKYLGAYLAVLGGCEGIVFGGGVGEHMPEIRSRILAPLRWVGVELDAAANEAARGGEARITQPASPIAVYVLPADEEHSIATAALACLATQPTF
jgi:acetate kinase